MSVFNLNPTVGSFLHEGYAFGIVENPRIPSSLLNWHIQMAFPLGMHHSDRLHFDFYPAPSLAGYAALGLLEMRDYTAKLPQIISRNKLSETVFGIIKKQKYALMYVDYFYVEGSADCAEKHYRHDLLLFDYIPSTQEFKGAAYTKNRQFGLVAIPGDRLAEAFTSPFARGKECYRYCRGDLLAALQAKPCRGRLNKLNLSDIRTQLVSYLEGADLAEYPVSNPIVNHICRRQCGNSSNAAFGIKVYDQIQIYFDRAYANGNLWHGLRVVRLLWEHKKLMKARLLRLAEEGLPLDPTFVSDWDEIEQLAYTIHLKTIAAHRRNLYSSTDFGNNLNKIKTLESDYIGRLLRIF